MRSWEEVNLAPVHSLKRRTRISRIHQKKKLSVSRSSANEGGGGFGGLNRNQREGAENGGEEFLKVEKRIPKRSKLEKSLVWGAFFKLVPGLGCIFPI